MHHKKAIKLFLSTILVLICGQPASAEPPHALLSELIRPNSTVLVSKVEASVGVLPELVPTALQNKEALPTPEAGLFTLDEL